MRTTIRLGAIAAAILAVACGGTASAPSGTTGGGAAGAAAVSYKGFQVSPATVTVKRGESVTWTNEDSAAHTVTAGTPGAKSGKFEKRLNAGAKESIAFNETGTFDYFCELHPTMVGKVVVN